MSREYLSGVIFQGKKEGSYYIPHYSEKIEELWGFTPYAGTLNIRVDPEKRALFLSSLNKKLIDEFYKDGKKFGSISCYEAVDKYGNRVILVVPELTKYGMDVLEVISSENIREKYNIKNGDLFKLYKP